MQEPNKTPQRVEHFKNVPVSQANTSYNDSDTISEIEELSEKVETANLPIGLKDKALKMVNRLRRMAKFGSYSGEYELIEKYVDWIVSIPWGKFSEDNLELDNAKELLDRNHFGLTSVKMRILEYLAVAKLNPLDQVGAVDEGYEKMAKMKEAHHAPILCFVGIQGIGKTSMAKSIAQALSRRFVRISLGAMGSVTDLKGQSRAFLDAEPGQVIKALVRTEVMNPLILLDEIDKVSEAEGRRADINATLLEILDPEQNPTFSDSYVDYPVDLSRVMFVATANNLSTLSAALLDRLEIIRFSSYSDEEKEQIAKHYLFPKVLKASGLKQDQVELAESVWPMLIRPLGFDAGVRQLERNIKQMCRVIAKQVVEGKGDKFVITSENFREYLPADIGVYS
ncbi:MAG: AAA family ATPase [Candidatus Dojkabacteria bacterium]|jgi:ATP-dependent Lon protease|nr:AAA family ATPase [Candidatus Dojkabacteria bacterium]